VRLTSTQNAIAPGLVLRLSLLAPLVLSACFSAAHAANPTSYFVKGPTANHKKIVIFVHGLLGDSTNTWTNPTNGAYWPKLIADDPDFQQYDVYAYGYSSPAIKEASTISNVATRMAQQLRDRRIFQQYDQIFFIAHSAGGLVTKRMLDTLNTPAQVKLLKKVRCVLYISVPSNGSELAGLASWLSSNPQFKSLSPSNAADFLQAVEVDWDEILRERTPASPFPRTFSAYETISTKGFVVVAALYDTQSDGAVLSFDENHSDIVKPPDRSNEVYEWTRSRILDASALIPISPSPKSAIVRPKAPHQVPNKAVTTPAESDPVTIVTTTLPPGVVGQPYSAQLNVIGGNGGPYTFKLLDTGKAAHLSEIDFSCLPSSLPIIIPPHTTSYLVIANEAYNRGRPLSYPVTADKEALTWPSQLLDESANDRMILKCDITRNGSPDLMDVHLTFALEYNFMKQPVSKPYAATFVIERLPGMGTVPVYFINNCPTETLISVPTSGTAKRAGEGAAATAALCVPGRDSHRRGLRNRMSRRSSSRHSVTRAFLLRPSNLLCFGFATVPST